MVRRRVLATFLVFSVAISATFGVSFATVISGSPLGSFYGGYHHVKLSSKENSSSSLTLGLTFRTASYDSGLLFLALQSDHAGYLAAGLRDSALEIVLKRDTQSPQILHSFNFSFQNTSLSPSDWHSLSVHYHQSQLSVNLDSNIIHSQTLSLDEGFSDVFFAGMDSFLSHRLFYGLPLAQFFIGCLTNVTVDSIPIFFVSDHQNGIGTECCPIPRTPMWCFQSARSNFSIPAILHDNKSIQISFNLQAIADGLVFFLFTEATSPSLHLSLSGYNLSLLLSNSPEGNAETLDCPPLLTKGDWHTVEVTLTSDSVRCSVGDRASDITSQLSLSFASTTDLILGSADVQGVERTSFEGCIEHFRVNGAVIRPSLGNQLIPHNESVQWNELNFDLHPLTVVAGDIVRVSDQNIRMTLPEEFFADESAFLYQQDIEAAIVIQPIEGPYQGSFVIGLSDNTVSQFTYDSLTSQDNETQIFYQHAISAENVTDEVVLQVSVECGQTTRVLFTGMLEITVIESMRSPLTVTHNEAITIAAGTRRVITPSHLTVVGRVNPNPNTVTFSLQSIEPMDACERNCDESRGKLFKTYNSNLYVMFFSQEELNEGNISFQHFEKFGTEPVIIKLLASTNGHLINGGSINVTIDVYPYDGHISFLTLPGVCLFVKEGSTALLEPKHLNTTTNFEDQDPVISYDLIEEPMYGYFERYIAYHNIYPDWHPITSVNPAASDNQISDINYFTQEDVNNGHVRYVHNHSSIFSENFRFRLRSTNLTGDSESLCIHIVQQALLVKPKISISIGDIQVNESGQVEINRTLLTTTPSQSDEYLTGVVDVEQMGIVYHLEAVPSFGRLLVGERELFPGDNFTFDDVSSGLLHYVHGGTEDHSDSFRVYAVATTTSTLLILTPDPSLVVTVIISVLPMNNHSPDLSSNLSKIRPPEGGFVIVTEDNILVTDEDRPKEVLTIYIRKKGPDPIGYFAFYDSPYTPVSRFTMQNISDEKVIFQHWLNVSASLEYTQILRLDDGNKSHYIRKPIMIEAVPHNLTVERRDSGCLANIDATLEPLTVTIQHDAFNFMLQDHFGEDRNLVPEVNVTISSPPLYGRFDNRVSGEQNINMFTVRELHEVAIEYHFTSQSTTTSSDDFSWTFTYGNSVVGPVQLQICISPIPVPRIEYVYGTSVAFGGMVNLDSTHLLATDNRGGPDMNDTLVYRIVIPPQNGSIIDQQSEIVSMNLTNFTQTDLNNRRVVYQNKYSDMSRNMQDSFTFQVCTPYECTDPAEFVIHVQFVNLTVLNTGFAVKEGKRHYITTKQLNIFAPSNSRNLRFFIMPPRHGNITLEAPVSELVGVQYFNLEDLDTNHVFYQNDGHEHLHDSFEFTATAEYRNEATGQYESLQFADMVNITIIPVNDNPPEIVLPLSQLEAVKDGSTRISSSLLQAHDYDSDMRDVDIVWRLKSKTPVYGYMYLDEDKGKAGAISNWTEGDLRANRLFYRNDEGGRDITVDIISYDITDGNHSSNVENTFIQLRPIIFASKATIPGPIQVTEGGNVTITTAYLSYCATNDPSLGDGDFLYTLRSLPTYGSLMFNGEPLRVGRSFNQSDLGYDTLVYIHDHSNSESDSFEYRLSVSNRIDTSDLPYTFHIAINSVDDDPPEVTIVQDPLFVVELSRVQINSSALEIYDHDSENAVEFDNIVCTIQSPPRYGLLPKHRFGNKYITSSEFTKYDVVSNQLWYNHTSLGHYEDSFTFRITDGINPQNETYEVHIVILPNQVLIQSQNITVEEGQLVHLVKEDFVIEHAYLSEVPGRINIIRPPANGVLSNVLTNKHSINEFTTSDLSSDSIVYNHNHNGREIILDSFDFYFESLQPEGLHRRSAVKTMFISIKPVDDEPPIFKRQRITADIISGQEVVLNELYLNVTDGDTPPSQLNYTFTLHIRGHIAYANNTKESIHWFTHADVMAGRVIFIHERDLIGNIEFNVTDGKQYALAILDVSTTVLELTCNQRAWSEISVDAGKDVLLTRDHLNCNIFSTNNVGPITFFVAPPSHGSIRVRGQVRKNFTMGDINENTVRYEHNDFDFWEEKEQLNASATANFVEPFLFQLVININYHRSNTSVLAANKGLSLNEGDRICLNVSSLDVRNLRYSAWIGAKRDGLITDISSPRDLVPVFNLTHLPHHGQLIINSTDVLKLPASFTHSDIASRGVCYQHSGSERFEDSIPFQLHFLKGNNASPLVFSGNHTFLNSVVESILIKITPVNDERPRLVTGKNLTIVLGFNINITERELNVVDDDSPASDITFTLLNPPQSATLLLGDEELQSNAEFTQADINNNQLQIMPRTKTSVPERFILSFKDEVNATEWKEVSINYTVSEHKFVRLSGKEVTYQQNVKEVVISKEHLNTETNGFRRETQFTIVSGPMNGRIVVGGGGGGRTSGFSQITIDEGKVKYIPNSDTTAYQDELSLRVVNQDIEHNFSVSFTSLAWGSVRKDASINLTSTGLSQSLPTDLLNLMPVKPPEILVIDKPRYGVLEVGPVRQSDKNFSFHYDDLVRGWVKYTWDYDQPVYTDTLVDNFTMIVLIKDMPPGKARISLRVHPPESYRISITTSLPVAVDHRTDPPPEGSPQTRSSRDGFPLYSLVLILGVFVILVIMIVVIALFCTTQQKRIRRKWQPGVARPPVQRTYPWSVDSHAPGPRAMAPPNYNFDPASQSGESDNEGHNSETSSGFSEPVASPRHSPTQGFSLPAQSQQSSQPGSNHRAYGTPSLVPPRTRSRARSNVSITFSSRQSVVSDVSIEDSPQYYSHSLPRPLQQQQGVIVVPTPVRPASHSAFSRVPRPLIMESGYNSSMFHGAEDSGVPSRAGSCAGYDDDCELPPFPSADVDVPLGLEERLTTSNVLPTLSCPSDAGPGPIELKSSLAIGDEDFLDLNDPNILQLLRSPNPVLRREEYWV